MAQTYYSENLILDALFSRGAFNPPTTWYVGLSTYNGTPPVNEVTAVVTEEVAGNNYARAAVTNDNANWGWTNPGVPLDGKVRNLGVIQFPMATPSGWGTVRHLIFFDAPTGGNAWFYTTLSSPVTVSQYNIPAFVPQSVEISNRNT